MQDMRQQGMPLEEIHMKMFADEHQVCSNWICSVCKHISVPTCPCANISHQPV